MDLWWSVRHHRPGGNIQVLTAPDDWPIWVFPARLGREYEVTYARTHLDLLPALREFGDGGHLVLARLGSASTGPFDLPVRVRDLDAAERSFNRVHAHVRVGAKQGNA